MGGKGNGAGPGGDAAGLLMPNAQFNTPHNVVNVFMSPCPPPGAGGAPPGGPPPGGAPSPPAGPPPPPPGPPPNLQGNPNWWAPRHPVGVGKPLPGAECIIM